MHIQSDDGGGSGGNDTVNNKAARDITSSGSSVSNNNCGDNLGMVRNTGGSNAGITVLGDQLEDMVNNVVDEEKKVLYNCSRYIILPNKF